MNNRLSVYPEFKKSIQNNEVVLHEYLHRKDDDHNAKESYLFNLADQTVFERLL